MKKLLIPFIGVLILIVLTPVILGKITNSNIDKKLSTMHYRITQLKKDIGYLTTTRVFKVDIDKTYLNTHIKGDLIVTLKFKNLPITTANFTIKSENFPILNDLVIEATSKDLKTFNYKVLDYDKNGIKIEGAKGVLNIDKYNHIDISIDKIVSNFISLNGIKGALTIKNFDLGLVEGDFSYKKWQIKHTIVELKGADTKEHIKVSLHPDNRYTIVDNITMKKFALKKDNLLLLGNLQIGLKVDNFSIDSRDMRIYFTTKWDETYIDGSSVDGADIKIDMTMAGLEPTLDNIRADLDINFQKELFYKLTQQLDPNIVRLYFDNYSTHIKIDKGIFINGNRIQ
jgi:hypothetical protein